MTGELAPTTPWLHPRPDLGSSLSRAGGRKICPKLEIRLVPLARDVQEMENELIQFYSGVD
jgi:hypothetical protein